jgi:hypothetical protein
VKPAEALVRPRSALLLFGIASFLAIALGAVAMAQADVPLGIWIRNPMAWLVAAAVSVFLASRGWLGSPLIAIAVIVIALSLLGPEQEGVHRWLGLGPIQLNTAALVLPAAIAVFNRTSAAIAVPCFAVIAALLAWQPDISQLAGFLLAAIILATARFGWRGAAGSIAISAAALALCLFRPDPLAPVAHVEGIFTLAAGQSPLLAIAMAISLAAAVLSPLLIRSGGGSGWLTPLALAAYFAATALAPLFGAYPVPLAGYGLSFVVGWWLGVAALGISPRRAVNSLTSG